MALDCNGPRGRQTSQRHGPAPDTDWVTGPNKLWDWDVTVLRSGEPGIVWYLYSLLDHFSRKAVAWLIDERQSSDLAQRLWDQGLVNEARLDLPHSAWPQSLSDRGAPMRSHSTRHYFKKLGIGQLFSRTRTPNDNPRIEAHFGTIKSQPVYPGYFADVPAAVAYFTAFYTWYNNLHPLTTLGMLTPNQVHTGQSACLLATRQAHQAKALASRHSSSHAPFTLEELITDTLPDVSCCPIYSWAGPNSVPQNTRHHLRN